jgi:hypothetical protein
MLPHIGETRDEWRLRFWILQTLRRRLLHAVEALEEEFQTDEKMDQFMLMVVLNYQQLMREVNRVHR